jgi:uncharacterized phiE125 gp8 family phage protein
MREPWSSLVLITAPAVEPVSLAEAKLHLKQDDITDDDSLINALIVAARGRAESALNRALITQTWEVGFDCFPYCDRIRLPRPPLQSVTTLKYTDTLASVTTWASSNYIVDTAKEPGELVLTYGNVWPTTVLSPATAVKIRYVAGYGANPESVPQEIRQWMLHLIGHMYEHRESVIVGQTSLVAAELPFLDGLLDSHRIFSFG